MKAEKGEDLTTLEKINYALPSYIPSILMGLGTITCIFGANAINKKQQASLVSAYAMLDRSYKEYKNKVSDMYGNEAEAAIEQAIVEDHIQNTEDEEKQLFYDERSERYFESTLFEVQKAEYLINRNLIMSDYVCLNDWYEALDLDIVEDGYAVGWTVGMLMDYYWQPWLDFDHEHWLTDDGRKCITVRFWQEPTKDFEEYE